MSNPKASADPVETPSIDARLVRKLAESENESEE